MNKEQADIRLQIIAQFLDDIERCLRNIRGELELIYDEADDD